MLFAITEAFSSIRDFMEAGGSVLWLIAILVFFMWAMIFERIWYFSHGHEFYIKDLASTWNNRSDKTSWHALQIREKMLSQAKVEINRNLTIIQTCVVLAPPRNQCAPRAPPGRLRAEPRARSRRMGPRG